MDSSETRTDENDSWNLRSPCLDAHHEAFILRWSWTVGNLYAANLHLGQSYVKQVKDLEKQRKVWLSRKEKEQEKMLRRWKDLEKQARKSERSDLNIYRSASQPTESGLIVAVPTKEYSVHYQYGFQKYEKLPRTQSMPSARSM